ncbi:MAG: SufD family Fe-S cluster assembly protein [Pseudomonadota bacterium]|nr:SufD family Fe-S cluster assembly protein [Pseudomonadota bacterium]
MSTDVSTPTNLDAWLDGGTERLAGTGLPWLDAKRSSALERVRSQGFPTSKQEGWRYTGLKPLTEQPFLRYAEPVTGVEDEDLDEVLIPGLDAHRVVLVNGRYVPHLSGLQDLPEGVRAAGLRTILEADPDAIADRLTEVAGDGANVFSALNTAGMDDGFVLLLDRDAVVDRPIEIIHLSVGMDEPRVAQPRHLVVLEEGARATLIERYVSLGASVYCTNSVLELSLGPDSGLTHYRVQSESPNAFHITGLYLSQFANSRYRGVNLGLGASWARTDLVVRFSGQDALCDLQGLYLAGDKQLMDYHLDVDHGVPGCVSRENFKGILHGRGRAVFDGRIFVAKDAQKTDAQLTNKISYI